MKTEAGGKIHINIFPITQRQAMYIFWYTFFQVFTYAILGGIWEKIYRTPNPLSLQLCNVFSFLWCDGLWCIHLARK